MANLPIDAQAMVMALPRAEKFASASKNKTGRWLEIRQRFHLIKPEKLFR
jgi:hypothetical protein